MSNKHWKRIVLDLDDTLCYPVNRDFENAAPNTKLISKVNKLFDEGWGIDIFTARGSISCASREEAKEKYYDQIVSWLNRHGVKYHKLSFEKPLAAYYVDDKGMSPEAFLETNIHQLKGGLSGADIYTDGKSVHKTDERCHDVKEWYDAVSYTKVSTPKINRIVGKTITMEYINHDRKYFSKNPYRALAILQESLEEFKRIEIQDKRYFKEYVERIRKHIKECEVEQDVLWALVWQDLLTMEWPEESFGHGDFGITNLLFKNDKVYLVDPVPEVFTCTQLDCAKFIASLYINGYDGDFINLAKRTLMSYNQIRSKEINTLIKCELTRVIKYHSDKEFILECIQNVY